MVNPPNGFGEKLDKCFLDRLSVEKLRPVTGYLRNLIACRRLDRAERHDLINSDIMFAVVFDKESGDKIYESDSCIWVVCVYRESDMESGTHCGGPGV